MKIIYRHDKHFLSHAANTNTCPQHTQPGSADSIQLRLQKLRPVAYSSSWTLLTTPPAVVTGHSDSSVVTLVLTVRVTVGSVCPGGLPPVITFNQWGTGPRVHACTWATSTAERSSNRLRPAGAPTSMQLTNDSSNWARKTACFTNTAKRKFEPLKLQ